MQIDKLIVSMAGVLGILVTYWFFLMKKDKVFKVSRAVEILVDGGYSPNVLSVPINEETKLIFLRRDKNSCLEEVVIPDFKIKKYLPLNTKVEVALKPLKEGEYKFSCGMNMFHGRLIVK